MAESEDYSVKYGNMTPGQLNSELRQIFGFIPEAANPVESGGLEAHVVYVPDADRRQKGEVYDVLNKRLSAVLGFAPITPHFREHILRFFWTHYVMLSGFDDAGREYVGFLLQENDIFDRQQANEVERSDYRGTLDSITEAIDLIVSKGSSTRDRHQWRLDSMEMWRRQFVACYGEEP